MRAVGCAVWHHPHHNTVAVVTFAGGYGPPPREEPHKVERASGGPDAGLFERVLSRVRGVEERVEDENGEQARHCASMTCERMGAAVVVCSG